MGEARAKRTNKKGVEKKEVDMNKKLRILFSSNSPWSPSGYAQQMADLLPALRDEGYEIGMVNFYGQEGGIFELDGIKCFPKIGDVWGTDAVVAHQKVFNPDCVITFQDTWVMDMNNVKQFKNWIPMAPIDHDPVPPSVLAHLKLAYRVITHSEFGEKELKRNGMHSTYIPLLVNTEIYKKKDRFESRKMMGIPEDIFLFGMVSANKDNPPRKSFQEVMDAFKKFHEKNPKSGIYFHTVLNQQGGFPIDQYARTLGLESCIYNIDPYQQLFMTDKNKMASIYSAFNCLLAPSTNEGFGVPIIEAQACEIPVITNNWTAMPELVKDGVSGYICSISSKRYTPLLSYIGIPDTNSIYNNMLSVFKVDRVKMGQEGRKNVLEKYDLKTNIKERWCPFLTKIEKELCS